MAFRFFTIPVQQSEAVEAELNVFLRSHKVLAVDRRWVDQGPDSFWCLCVDYLETGGVATATPASRSSRSQVDYKEVLRPEEFAIFAKLRELRKEMAQAEAVPVYTIFTNEQLAQMVQSKARTKAALEKIVGVGNARTQKYGPRLLEFLAQQWQHGDETNGQPV